MRSSLKIAVVALLLSVPIAVAGGIKVWSSNDTVTAADLNANFSHIHNTMVGGHGARLVNADVSATASIAHSKLATPSVLPKAWAATTATCSADPCAYIGAGVSSITWLNPGEYRVNWTTTRANTSYGALVTPMLSGLERNCIVKTRTTTSATVECEDYSAASQNTGFTVILLDDDN